MQSENVVLNLITRLALMRREDTFRSLLTRASATNESRVVVAREYLKKYGKMPFHKGEKLPSMKSNRTSGELRLAGNSVFRKDPAAAHVLYSQSIAAALHPSDDGDEDSEELAMAFANRSAVYFEQKKYQACLTDIEHALSFHYPDRLKYKLAERRARCWLFLGEEEKARGSLQEAMELVKGAHHLDQAKRRATLDCLKELKAARCTARVERGDGTPPLPDKTPSLPDKTYGQHPQIASASNCLEVRQNRKYGRFIVATRDIKPGDTLLIEEPFASKMDDSVYWSRCYHCSKRADAMIPCRICNYAMFCSHECRESAWELYHNIECTLLKPLKEVGVGDLTLLALRIFSIMYNKCDGLGEFYSLVKTLEGKKYNDQKHIKGFDEAGQYKSNDYEQIHHLFSNLEDASTITEFAVRAGCLVNALEVNTNIFTQAVYYGGHELSKTDVLKFVGGLIFKYSQICHFNSCHILEYNSACTEDVSIGTGVYSAFSLLCHSCDPNAIGYCKDNVFVIAAHRFIGKGEQICVSYGPTYDSARKRDRATMCHRFGFVCSCEACEQNWLPWCLERETEHVYTFFCPRCGTPMFYKTPTTSECRLCSQVHDISESFIMLELLTAKIAGIPVSNRDEVIAKLAQCLKIVNKLLRNPNPLAYEVERKLRISSLLKGNIIEK